MVDPEPLSRRTVLLGALAAGTAAALVSACGIDDPGQELRARVDGTVPDVAALDPAASAVNGLGIDLFRVVAARNPGNVAISPLAVAASLAPAALGAAGTTRQQLDRLLRTTAPTDGAASGSVPTLPGNGLVSLAALLGERTGDRANDTRTGAITLDLLRSLWIARGTTIEPAYLDQVARSLDTGVHVIDFRSDPDAARAAVNRWASDTTRGRITAVVPRGAIDEFSRLVAVSALQLLAPWDRQFPKARTKPTPFTRGDGSTVQPATMAAAVTGTYVGAPPDRPDLRAVVLPYLGRQLELVLLAPTERPVDEVIAGLRPEDVRAATTAVRAGSYDVRLPRFTVTSTLRLDDALGDLGCGDALSRDRADFSGIAKNEPVYLSAAYHQTAFAADEDGSGAKVATVQKTDRTSAAAPAEEVVAVDRPFVFLVRERQTGLILTIGRIADPTAG